MKIAIVHDELVRRGGAEQATLRLHEAFPTAPIYTSCYNPQNTYDEFKKCDIRPSWFSKFVKDEKWLKRLFYPFSIWAMRSINLREYDVVLISTTNCAKYVNTNPENLFIAFCHYPFRLAWFPESYSEVVNSNGLKNRLYKFVINRLKKIDYNAAQNIDWFITNTPEISEKIKVCYNPRNEISVIKSSIPCSNFFVSDTPRLDYYLVISRIEYYKKVDLVVDAFLKMPDKKVIIVGTGSKKRELQAKATSNIEFREGLSKNEIADLYANCKAFIFPQEEDYGLTPLEANASGRPVIAYGKGGVTQTMIPYNGNNAKKCTAYFFYRQTSDCLIDGIKKMDMIDFDHTFIREHAETFDQDVFVNNIRKFVLEKYDLKENKE
ncbi:glycosyltransferase [Dysgonomonas sp. 25]|uniref:glycosyltransferase n=1 Tax=Dysgonomonas sp. 25 TaxID=2302933 RepID=UPI0013D5727D|nr:glycosyltransferase [Dysgonomonas sp. 25]NDV69018.1 glycosyltransferase [Dysgonomonas sp. 25]